VLPGVQYAMPDSFNRSTIIVPLNLPHEWSDLDELRPCTDYG
jgi:hypothetical protein